MDILLGPIYSFFNIPFYRRVTRLSFWKGLLYLLYLSFLFSSLIVFIFAKQGKPMIDQFVDWFTHSLPQLTLTKEGVVTSVAQPFTMKNPLYGTVMVVNTQSEDFEKLPDSVIYVTKTKLVFKNGKSGEIRMVSLIPKTGDEVAKWKDFMITGPLLEGVYQRVISFAYPVIFLFMLPVFFIWKLIASLFYSLIALIVNLFRKEKLNYQSLLVCSMFAMTPVIILQWSAMFIPVFGRLLNLFTSVVITTFFLTMAILVAQEKSETEGPVGPA